MRKITNGLMGAIAAAGVLAATPLSAAAPDLARSNGLNSLAMETGFHKKNKRHRHYSDQRVNNNTRIWRDGDGRYRCKRDDGTTGLLIGGVVGGLAGNEIAGRGDKLLGTVIGAGAGALVGREIDRSNARCR